MKIFYPNRMTNGTDADREAFYTKLKSISNSSVKTERIQGNFYDEVFYTLPNGDVWVYTEDMEYGIPYSLELKTA